MTVINTNIKSLVSQNALNRNSRDLSMAMEQLSTGKRINSAKDDAAGLAISSRMTSQIRGLDQAVRNANDGISLLQTTEGALVEVTNMMQRMRELAVQSANDTYTQDDRASLDLEFQELKLEIHRVAQTTQWNGMNVLNNSQDPETAVGTGGLASDPTSSGAEVRNVQFQIGANANQVITFALRDFSVFAQTGSGASAPPPAHAVFAGSARIDNIDITSATTSNTAIGQIDGAINALNDQRAFFGATMNRLTYAGDNLTNISRNTSESRSRILDADYAKASSELARTQIIQQAATAVLAQANMDQQSVLKLLQG
jgi:flagellin